MTFWLCMGGWIVLGMGVGAVIGRIAYGLTHMG